MAKLCPGELMWTERTTRTHIPARKRESRCEMPWFAIPYHLSFFFFLKKERYVERLETALHRHPFWLGNMYVLLNTSLPPVVDGLWRQTIEQLWPVSSACVSITLAARKKKESLQCPARWWCKQSNCMLLLCITCSGQFVDNIRAVCMHVCACALGGELVV